MYGSGNRWPIARERAQSGPVVAVIPYEPATDQVLRLSRTGIRDNRRIYDRATCPFETSVTHLCPCTQFRWRAATRLAEEGQNSLTTSFTTNAALACFKPGVLPLWAPVALQ
jgi:hypothetical protein